MISFLARFTFTQLDANHPNQEYTFCLGTTDDDEMYSIFDCTPIQLSDETLDALIEPLNRTNDMLSFVRNIRHTFVQHICKI
jgi:Chromosome segregation protein Spc25